MGLNARPSHAPGHVTGHPPTVTGHRHVHGMHPAAIHPTLQPSFIQTLRTSPSRPHLMAVSF